MILIDIEMPERCGECPCFHAEHPMYCQLIKPPDKDKRIVAPYGLPRPEWCPLKEQEVVEPVLMREGRNEYYNDYVCPECDNELVFGQNFCSECGRQVKWDGRT